MSEHEIVAFFLLVPDLHVAEPLRDDAAALGFDIDRDFVGLDQRNDIPLLHCLAHVDGPLHDCSLHKIEIFTASSVHELCRPCPKKRSAGSMIWSTRATGNVPR
jgi:hypothetical protein